MLKDFFYDIGLVNKADDPPFEFPQGGEPVEPHPPITLQIFPGGSFNELIVWRFAQSRDLSILQSPPSVALHPSPYPAIGFLWHLPEKAMGLAFKHLIFRSRDAIG